MSLSCKECNKNYKSYKTLWQHNKTFHANMRLDTKERNFTCDNCNKKFRCKQNLQSHLINACKNKPVLNNTIKKIINLEKEISKIKNKIPEIKSNDTNTQPIYQIININNIKFNYRIKDNYINANELCLAENKNFNDWLSLVSTKELIIDIGNNINMLPEKLIENKKWIHSDLGIHLAMWISPKFAILFNKWLLSLVIKNQEKELQSIKDQYQRKQLRKKYSNNNVIYIVTSEDNKNKRIYIVGKAKDLKDRLSGYNKIAEHEVVHYKSCMNENDMRLIEQIVLNKLDKYREKANRDRFILPVDKPISLFTSIIDNTIKFFYENTI
jgi:hypothetical protein